MPSKFKWFPAYANIKKHWESEGVAKDVYAAPTYAAAIREIDQAVIDTHLKHRVKPSGAPQRVEGALLSLRRMRKHAGDRDQRERYEGISESLTDIHRLTYAKKAQLSLRASEFAAVSIDAEAVAPGPEALGGWLRRQAAAAGASSIEGRYFTQLEEGLSPESDPWAVSRELIASLPAAGDAAQAKRLQEAHERLVRAMAGALSEQPVSSKSREPAVPQAFQWGPAYEDIKWRQAVAGATGDFYAVAACTAALGQVDQAVTEAYMSHRMIRGPAHQDPVLALAALRRMCTNAKTSHAWKRAVMVTGALEEIYRLTFLKRSELLRRDREFAAVSPGPKAATPGPEALGEWLRRQAAGADASSFERRYFTQLAAQLGPEDDPWVTSRKLVASLPTEGDAGQKTQLEAAHDRLVRAMAGDLSRPPVPAGSGGP